MGVPAAYLDPEAMDLEEDLIDHTDQTEADPRIWEDYRGHTALGEGKSVPGVWQLGIPLWLEVEGLIGVVVADDVD